MRFIAPWTKAEKRFPFSADYVLKDDAIIENLNLKLINSKTYKIIYPFLVAGFLISYTLSFVFFFSMTVIILMTALSLFIPVIVTLFAKNFKETGRLSIDIRHIVVVQNEKPPLIIPIEMLQDLKISRGSTVHLQDRGPYPAETHDNWITFTFNGKPYKLEFCITDKEESDAFELMIYRLKGVYGGFRFESI